MALTQPEWQSLALKACDDNGLVAEEWDNLWKRTESLDTADATGELRYRAIVVMALQDIMLPYAARNVATSEGGGQSGEWGQYYDHLKLLLDAAKAEYDKQLKGVVAMGAKIAPMLTISLTPVYPGQPQPGSPRYMGDPRFPGRVC